MRKHVMVRIGGGWDTFEHYITKHDPCRIKVAGMQNILSEDTIISGRFDCRAPWLPSKSIKYENLRSNPFFLKTNSLKKYLDGLVTV